MGERGGIRGEGLGSVEAGGILGGFGWLEVGWGWGGWRGGGCGGGEGLGSLGGQIDLGKGSGVVYPIGLGLKTGMRGGTAHAVRAT